MIKPLLFLLSTVTLNAVYADEAYDPDDLSMYGYETVADSEEDDETNPDSADEAAEFNPGQMMDVPDNQTYLDEDDNPDLYSEGNEDLEDEDDEEAYPEIGSDENDDE